MKREVILFIDSTQKNKLIISLSVNGKTIERISKKTKAQNTLLLIDKILKKHRIGLKDLTKIKVNNLNNDSFIGLRIGLTIANTLAFILGIRINGGKTPVLPEYE